MKNESYFCSITTIVEIHSALIAFRYVHEFSAFFFITLQMYRFEAVGVSFGTQALALLSRSEMGRSSHICLLQTKASILTSNPSSSFSIYSSQKRPSEFCYKSIERAAGNTEISLQLTSYDDPECSSAHSRYKQIATFSWVRERGDLRDMRNSIDKTENVAESIGGSYSPQMVPREYYWENCRRGVKFNVRR